MEQQEKKFSYYGLYLRKYLKDAGSPLQHDEEFINERTGQAEAEYENTRRDGLTVDQAQERAMSVLISGI